MSNVEQDMSQEEQEPKSSGLPSQFVAVFYDDEGEVQVGASGFIHRDMMEWALMLRAAAEKLELQQHLLVRERMMNEQQGNGLIVPR